MCTRRGRWPDEWRWTLQQIQWKCSYRHFATQHSWTSLQTVSGKKKKKHICLKNENGSWFSPIAQKNYQSVVSSTRWQCIIRLLPLELTGLIETWTQPKSQLGCSIQRVYTAFILLVGLHDNIKYDAVNINSGSISFLYSHNAEYTVVSVTLPWL